MNIIDKVLEILPVEQKDKLLKELPLENKDEILKGLLAKDKDKMSFKTAMALCKLPVVTFFQGEKSFNFLLDTGSSSCIIDSNALDGIKHKVLNEKSDLFGMEGNSQEVGICEITLYFNENAYTYNFLMQDMKQSFALIRKQTGVVLHGILGSDFFNEFKYILDFAELIAYSKK